MVPLRLRISPCGSKPPTRIQVYGATPPEATTACEYETVSWPLGNEEVEMESGATPIEMVSGAVAMRPPASVTCTVKWNVPLAVGVPLITPEGEIVSPGGSDPELGTTIQVNGDWPPFVNSACEYATPTEPLGNEVVPTASELATNRLRPTLTL